MGHLESEVVRGQYGGTADKLYGLDLSRATVRARLPIAHEAIAAE